jgi:hypothetical protein
MFLWKIVDEITIFEKFILLIIIKDFHLRIYLEKERRN